MRDDFLVLFNYKGKYISGLRPYFPSREKDMITNFKFAFATMSSFNPFSAKCDLHIFSHYFINTLLNRQVSRREKMIIVLMYRGSILCKRIYKFIVVQRFDVAHIIIELKMTLVSRCECKLV